MLKYDKKLCEISHKISHNFLSYFIFWVIWFILFICKNIINIKSNILQEKSSN